ncbi:hypothetical protein HY638_03515 [Candidatus Woesearchaeota archaeon]|nr:hypothetical protein [Candidatus Woesearchaeota archaeon]
MDKKKIIAVVVVVLLLGVIAYFFISSETAGTEIPAYVTGEKREIYEWARTPEGSSLLRQIPCYCGCRYEGHMHAANCFWRDDGTFDKHGITCSVCLDIAKKARQMHDSGKGVCEIRKEIDAFYEPNKELATDTPMPEGC